MQYREIDRPLDVEAEPSTDKQGTDHLGASGLPPQPTEHKIRADADPPQLGKLAAIEARQHDRAHQRAHAACPQAGGYGCASPRSSARTPCSSDNAKMYLSSNSPITNRLSIGRPLIVADRVRGAHSRDGDQPVQAIVITDSR